MSDNNPTNINASSSSLTDTQNVNTNLDATNQADNKTVPVHKKGKGKIILLIIIIIVAIVLALLWWINYQKYISTDDANLESYRIDVAPQVTGLITKLHVMEGDTVKIGDALFDIESASMVSRREEAQAQYQQLLAQLEVAKVSLSEAEKNYEITRLAEQLSTENYKRGETQYNGGAIPLEAFQTLEENWKSAKLQAEVASNRIESVKANIEATKMSAEAALANVQTMNTDLSYYHISSPADGVIGKRWALPGDIVSAGQTVFTLNKGTDIWVAVFLEETKFANTVFYIKGLMG